MFSESVGKKHLAVIGWHEFAYITKEILNRKNNLFHSVKFKCKGF